MSVQNYRLDIFDPWTGSQVAEVVTSLLYVEVEQKLNWFDSFTYRLPHYDEHIRQYLVKDAMVELYRQLDDGTWYFELGGFHRTPQDQILENDERVIVSYGRSYKDLLRRRGILYPADRVSEYTLKGGPAETVMKSWVTDNATTAANNPLRYRYGAPRGAFLSIEPDQGRGPRWAGQRSNKSLLDVLQDIATSTGVDFSVRRLSGTNLFEFYCGYPQLGDDLTTTVQFNPLHGNMTSPSLTLSATEEVNVVAVLGQGEGTARRRLVMQTGATNDSPWNDIEEIVDARGEATYEGLLQAGTDALAERAAKESFTCKVLQTGSLQYGRDYKVGDTVSLAFGTVTRTKKIIGCRLTGSEDAKEELEFDFADLPAS